MLIFMGSYDGFTLFMSAMRRLRASFAKPAAEWAMASESVELNDFTAVVSVVVVPMCVSSSEKC